ncbi:MAG: gamma-glutamyl-gamma-aminobutyrate hydrolase family protein [Verrucomicrobiia bacterium]|jgi:putative glutamine amidotransferase
MKPVIAITPEAIKLSRVDGRGAFCGVSYSQAIEKAGGVPLVLPLTRETKAIERFLTLCDGFLLTGGGDMAEASGAYGRKLTARERQTLSSVDEERDELELCLVRRLMEEDIPVLGICRGIQVMNVALGGTLLADIPNHRHAKSTALMHQVEWTCDGRLPRLLGDCRRVNSTHHQALDVVASAFKVAARTSDGIVEAVENSQVRLMWGVQFHPERLLQVAPQFLRLFEALVNEARRR